MRIGALLLIFISPILACAAGDFGKGVGFDLGLGYGGATIKNPDDSKANYRALAAIGRFQVPLFERDKFSANVVPSIRYLDLSNTANNGAQSEVGNLIGPGLGLQIRAYKFLLGMDYHLMLGRHYAVGNFSRSSKYEMPTINMYAGYTVPFKQLSVSIYYSQSTGTIPASSTGLSKDAPYSDQVYWLQFTYSTGASFAKFFDYLF